MEKILFNRNNIMLYLKEGKCYIRVNGIVKKVTPVYISEQINFSKINNADYIIIENKFLVIKNKLHYDFVLISLSSGKYIIGTSFNYYKETQTISYFNLNKEKKIFFINELEKNLN